jgi:hypothetical protein
MSTEGFERSKLLMVMKGGDGMKNDDEEGKRREERVK